MDLFQTGPHRVKLEGWIACAPFESLLNIKIESAQDGRACLTMPFLYDYANGASMLHGGAMVSLADTSVVMAIKTVLPSGTHFATTHMEVDFLQPVWQGTVTALAEVKRENERHFSGKVVIVNDKNEEMMRMSAVFKVARKREK